MLKEFVDRILELVEPKEVTIGGLRYGTKSLNLMEPPLPACVGVATLTGLVDLINADLENVDHALCLLHVEDYRTVALVSRSCDKAGRRPQFLRARVPDEPRMFTFGQWLDPETFIIGLLALFVKNQGVEHLLKVTSSLAAEAVSVSEDDGITQRATVKQGMALKTQIDVMPRVSLAPYRTFREIAQPVSEFVFRLRTANGGPPLCALFEADGGKWKNDAVQAIKTSLQEQITDIPVIA